MPKHKKTREEKRKADERRASSETLQYRFSLPSTTPLPTTHTTVILDTNQTVRHDLLRTAIISFAILALQITLFFLLKNHVLAFSFVRY